MKKRYRHVAAKIRNLALRCIQHAQVWLTGYSSEPTCPWCGAACSTEVDEMSFDGDCREMECDECGKEYERHLDLSFAFATEKVMR